MAALGLLLAWQAHAGTRPAAGGVKLFEALERAPLAVVAHVRAPRRLDGESFVAELEISLVLRGRMAHGTVVPVAWEELAHERPTRFAAGDRVLLALEPLSGASIWRQRIPDPEERLRTFGIGSRGDGFVREPSSGAVELVEHFLALPRQLRDGNAGVAHLVLLAEGAEPVLAKAALERLASVDELDRTFDPTTAARFVRVLLRDPPELGAAALDLVGGRHLSSLRAPLGEIATADGRGPAPAYDALARLDGELPPVLAQRLLARNDSPAHRALAARYAPDAADAHLARLLRLDPSPQVRGAAVTRLVELRGVDEIDRVLFALGDPEPSVRTQAMLAVASLGDAAVPALRRVVDSGTPEAARTAVGALRATGPEGVRALAAIADEHPDESVRTLARIALGRPIGHGHGSSR